VFADGSNTGELVTFDFHSRRECMDRGIGREDRIGKRPGWACRISFFARGRSRPPTELLIFCFFSTKISPPNGACRSAVWAADAMPQAPWARQRCSNKTTKKPSPVAGGIIRRTLQEIEMRPRHRGLSWNQSMESRLQPTNSNSWRRGISPRSNPRPRKRRIDSLPFSP